MTRDEMQERLVRHYVRFLLVVPIAGAHQGFSVWWLMWLSRR